jgi:PAS domain S-box
LFRSYKKAVFEAIEEFARHAPIPIYWYDENSIMLGANEPQLQIVGNKSITDFAGKTPYDVFPFEIADKLVKNNQEIIRLGKVLSCEEQIKYTASEETKYFTSYKAPLYDNNKKNIGVVGTAIDVTVEKNAERLKLETERQRIKLKEQENFKKLVDQAADDIQSPLAILLLLVHQCMDLTKKKYLKPLKDLLMLPRYLSIG